MTPELWQRVKERFEQASRLPAASWVPFLESVETDAAVRQNALGLLEHRTDAFEVPEGGATNALERGRRVGRFEIERLLGRGGMASVYLAHDVQLGRPVALKVLPPLDALDEDRRARFRREARAIAAVRHPNIATVFHIDELDGHLHFALEYLPNGDLHRRLTERREARAAALAGGARTAPGLPILEVAHIGLQVARALEHAHGHGIVHRDVTPRNLLFAIDGQVKVVDFGLARDLRDPAITQTGRIAGTPHYMSPEQARVIDAPVDHRTDVYALGVVLYEMLTLERPIEGGTSPDVLAALKERTPIRVRQRRADVPRDLETIVHKAMEKEPRHRYARAADLAEDLARFLRHEPILSTPPSGLARVLRWVVARRRTLVRATLAAGVLVGGAWITRELLVRADRRERWAELERLVTSAPRPDALATPDLARVFRIVADLEADPRGLDESDALPLLATWIRHRDERREALRAAVLAEIAKATGAGEDVPGSMLARLEAENHLRRFAALFPDDELTAWARDPTFLQPRVELRAEDPLGQPMPATGTVQRIDPLTCQPGKPVVVGTLPRTLPVDIGYHRFTIVFADGSFREFDRLLLDAAEPVVVRAVHGASDAAIVAGMIAFPTAEAYQTPEHPRTDDHLAGRTVLLAPYAIDPTEVSNGDYQAFLDAHPDAARPKFWVEPSARPPDWDELPVVGLSWTEMRTYAEWIGKRLPTFAEWDRAARGLEGRRYPWGDDPDDPSRANTDAPLERVTTFEAAVEAYLRHARPVRSFEAGRSPEGAYHLFGNVEEFTGSIKVLRDPQTPVLHERIYAGHSWRDSMRLTDLSFQGYTRTDRRSAMYYLGFRCAKSLRPPQHP